MTGSIWLFADAPQRTYFELGRLQSMTEWWQWLLLLAVLVCVLAIAAVMYIYDSVELPSGMTAVLLTLRVLAFIGLLVFFLDVERRSERKIVKNSRALLLVDTSQSMGLADGGSQSGAAAASRIEQVTAELEQGTLLNKLRQKHDVVVYRFDQAAKPVEVASFSKLLPRLDEPNSALSAPKLQQVLPQTRLLAMAAGGMFLFSIMAGLIYLFTRGDSLAGADPSWLLWVGVILLVGSVVTLAVANLHAPEISLRTLFGMADKTMVAESANPLRVASATTADDETTDFETTDSETTDSQTAADGNQVSRRIDWKNELLPHGTETRLGESLRYLANKERGGPVSGIVVFSDGGNNAGIEHTAAIVAAREARIPVYTVGLGSSQRPRNVRVVDLEAPPRVYPGDKFTLTGYLQARGFSGRSVKIELASAPAASSEQSETFEEEQPVTLGEDGQVKSVKFEVAPSGEGRRVYKLRVIPPDQDHDSTDNEITATVDVVQRKNRVLLFAGGPLREFRFLRNQLFRDRDTTVDVLLQTGQPGISQEAHNLIFEFPTSVDELFQYDCIVAFDPDWDVLDELQVKALERWVAEKAGGLIVIAGPVYTPQWAGRTQRDTRTSTIKALYPVVFYSQTSATLNLGRFGGETAWPMSFTREGMEAPFLWLDDTAQDSETAWAEFDGVYGYYAVKDPKPGAHIYARFSDPETAIDNQLPIYMAAQYYGAGRVFFQASGEMWRLRSVDEAYFERYYTKLIRWVSEGRLLRDSSRGVLLVDKDRCLLGDQVAVSAMLNDPQQQPLKVEQVAAILVHPDRTRTPLSLRKVQGAAREGMYGGQFTALQQGDYRVELSVPESAENELLAREVRVRVPDLEIEKPERNDPLLQEIAQKTGGEYFVGVSAAMHRQGAGTAPVYDLLDAQDQETYLPGTLDKNFQKLLMTWLLGLICGVLFLEWLIRRLRRLA